jgi:hypothetical protein
MMEYSFGKLEIGQSRPYGPLSHGDKYAVISNGFATKFKLGPVNLKRTFTSFYFC